MGPNLTTKFHIFPWIMLAEHIIYSAALAILVGMVFYKYTGRDHSWIIIVCAWAPDIDLIANRLLTMSGFTLLFEGHEITHGVFHNVAMMVIFAVLVAFLLNPVGIQFFDGLLCSAIGFGAHLLEDALVYNPGYAFLWPFSSQVLGLGLIPNLVNEENYYRDFFGIANIQVLAIGMILLIIAIIIRTWSEGSTSWLRWYMPEWLYKKFFGKKETGLLKSEPL